MLALHHVLVNVQLFCFFGPLRCDDGARWYPWHSSSCFGIKYAITAHRTWLHNNKVRAAIDHDDTYSTKYIQNAMAKLTSKWHQQSHFTFRTFH